MVMLQFNGGRMVMFCNWPVKSRENGYVTEVDSLMEGEWSLQRWPVWFKHILFMTEHDKGLGRAKKLCLAHSKTHTCTYNLIT